MVPGASAANVEVVRICPKVGLSVSVSVNWSKMTAVPGLAVAEPPQRGTPPPVFWSVQFEKSRRPCSTGLTLR